MTWEIETYPGQSGPENSEYSIEVTHVMFDWSEDKATNGMNIKWNNDVDLEHKGNGVGTGEYVPEEGNDEGRNDPVLWRAGNAQKVRVRIKLKAVLTVTPLTFTVPTSRMKMKIRAINLYTGCGYLNLAEREVEFYENANGEYVSLEAPIPPGQSLPALGEYPIFDTGSLPDEFADHIARYEFRAADFKMWDDGLQQWSTINPTPHELRFDLLSRMDGYSVLAEPTTPWGWTAAGATDATRYLEHPWASALAFVCYPANCAGLSNIRWIANRLNDYLFEGHGLRYEHSEGKARCAGTASQSAEGIAGQGSIQLTPYMAHYFSEPPTCNCDDQACATTALLNLVKGGCAQVAIIPRFGYIYANDMVGGERTNHPFFWNGAYHRAAITGSPPEEVTDLTEGDRINGKKARSKFKYHSVCILEGWNVHDACVGPVSSLGIGFEMDEYLEAYRDNSSAAENGPILWDETDDEGNRVSAVVGTTVTMRDLYIDQ